MKNNLFGLWMIAWSAGNTIGNAILFNLLIWQSDYVQAWARLFIAIGSYLFFAYVTKEE